MYKNKNFEINISKNYSKYQNAGLVGYLMDICHKNLENKFIKKNGIVLEIGPGISPHINYLNENFEKYFMLDQSLFSVNFLKKKYNKDDKIIIKKSVNSSIPFPNNYFDRIIIVSCFRAYNPSRSFFI